MSSSLPVFLHIPHTSGRALKRYCRNNSVNLISAHNAEEIEKLPKEAKTYFILRDPYERFVAEFLHYSRRLDAIGIVNHLNKSDITIDYTDPFQYCAMEVNRNVACKFLTQSTDFGIPIHPASINNIIEQIRAGKIVYDVFQKRMTYQKLGLGDLADSVKAYGQRENEVCEAREAREALLRNNKLRAHHKTNNSCDYVLFDLIQ